MPSRRAIATTLHKLFQLVNSNVPDSGLDRDVFELELGRDSRHDFDFAEKEPIRATGSDAQADLPDRVCHANVIHS
jgi:hypothetical protein